MQEEISVREIAKREQKTRGRMLAILLFLFEVGMMFAYGFGGQFQTIATTTASDPAGDLVLYTMVALLAILGFGLIIVYSNNGTILGMITTLMVVSITVQGSPLLQSFFYKIFNGFDVQIPITNFDTIYEVNQATLSFYTEKVSMIVSTSLLVAFTSFSGKVGGFEIFVITVVYNIGWHLAYMSSIYITKTYAPTAYNFYDGYGTNYIYVFASFFGLFTSVCMNCRPSPFKKVSSLSSSFIALIGTGFIFATLPFTGIIYPVLLNTPTNILRNNVGPFNIYFAMTASVISTYIFSAIFGGGKVGVREALIGTISGGVTIAVISDTVPNIGACIAIGAFSGLISGFYMRVIYPRINILNNIDNLGLFGPILINSFFGSFVIAPSYYDSLYNLQLTTSTIPTGVTTTDLSKYQLVYYAVAAGTGIVLGLISGIFAMLMRSSQNLDYRYQKIIGKDFGLYQAYDERSAAENKTAALNVYHDDRSGEIANQGTNQHLRPNQYI